MRRLLQDWITEQADTRPERVAVVSRDTRVTYGALEAFSNQVARMLKARGCRHGDRVALLVPKSPMAIAGLLGIYKADCVYVPLDPSSPPARLKKILESCGNKWILAAGPLTTALVDLLQQEREGGVSLGWLDGALDGLEADFALRDIVSCPTVPLDRRSRPDDPAHILFTSGSTGTPKGVVITHANVVAVIDWATKYFAMGPSDRVSAFAPLHFDLSFFDIFGAAAVGAEAHLVPPEASVIAQKLADFIRSSELTQWFSVPSVLSYMAKFDAIRFHDFPVLRRLMWCGEVFPTPGLAHWMARLPHVTFTNLYGPTETTVFSSYYTVPECPVDPQAAIPIGAPCEGEELLVLDESQQPLPRGEIGEICIAGIGLARGYWHDQPRTAAAFPPYPGRPGERLYRTGDLGRLGDDGLVYFLGRQDSQIKSRGYRIELGEIESALNAVDGVRESAVVALTTEGFEGAVICCAYVPNAGRDITSMALRHQLSQALPSYMLPARWLAFDDFPKNANGKTDRPRLRAIFADRFDAHATQTAQLA